MPVPEVQAVLRSADDKMKKAASVTHDDLNRIRTGRASPALVEKLMVDAYGTSTPLNQLASINGMRNLGNNCFNYPVAPQTPREAYRKVLAQALEDLKKYRPDLVAVSAGFDAYAHDPIANETLEAEDYHWLGEAIRKLGIPTFSVLEGGYSQELPELILAYLQGLASR